MSRKPRVERNHGRLVSPAAKRIALKLRELTRVAGTFEERRAMSAQIMSEALSQVVSEFAEEEHAKQHVECGTEGLTRTVGDLRVAPWPRVYVDLRAIGVRGEEAAEHLLEVTRGA